MASRGMALRLSPPAIPRSLVPGAASSNVSAMRATNLTAFPLSSLMFSPECPPISPDHNSGAKTFWHADVDCIMAASSSLHRKSAQELIGHSNAAGMVSRWICHERQGGMRT